MHLSRSIPTLFSLVGPILWWVASPASGQEPSSLFIERVDVNVVNVEVFVTDKKGDHVAGLKADDFEVFEDGEPVEISNFYTVARGDRVVSGFERDQAMVEGRPLPTLEVPEDQRLHFVVYIDFFNLQPASRTRVLEDLEGFVEDRVIQGDQVMLVSYNRTVQVVQPFTDDRNVLAEALHRIRKTATHRQISESERLRTLRDMTIAFRTPGAGASSAYQHLRSYVQKARSDLRHSTRAVQSVVRSLAGLPGRKALLYVSEGLPQRPGEELYQHLRDLNGPRESIGGSMGQRIDPSIEALRNDESQLFDVITRDANAHQVTLYTVDARGPASAALSAAHQQHAASPGGHQTLTALRDVSLQEPLIHLAERTGGSAILNTANFAGGFADLGRDFDGFYSLGYRSRRGGDGGYHKIEVRVKEPKLKVRHRNGYVDKPEGERVADRTFSALIFDFEANPLGIEVDFGKPEKDGRNAYLLPVLVRIPFRDITLLPQGDAEEGRLSIFLVVQDEEGGISELQKIPYPVKVPQEMVAEARKREAGYTAQLKIGGGTPKIAVGVWDELSGTESFVQKRVLVGKEKGRKRGGRAGR